MEISQHDGTVPGEPDNRDNNTWRTNSYPEYRNIIDLYQNFTLSIRVYIDNDPNGLVLLHRPEGLDVLSHQGLHLTG